MAVLCEVQRRDYTEEYIENIPRFTRPSDLVNIGENTDDDEFPEIELVEVPVVKRMVFQFKKPVKLEFS
ncbi:MAG: hypothetical protein LBC59_05720 [Chitinispirillales bacterium]|jgi:hypothetical protein|nr:hypothetical protein [Chitinispirillales bacterium]